jgi:hypothetical protein
MALRLLNRAKMTVTGTPGTGTITLGSADTAYQAFVTAGIATGDVVKYLIEDATSWEIGYGTYTSAGTTLARTTVIASSSGGAKISATSAAKVSVVADAQAIASGGGWVPLSFSSTVTIFGTAGLNVSNQSIVAAAGDFLEVEGFVYKLTGSNCRVSLSPDAANGYMFVNQGDGNNVLYSYASGSANNRAATGTNANQTWTGMHHFHARLNVQNTGSTNNTSWVEIDQWPSGLVTENSVSFVGTNIFYVESDDITKCALRARIISPTLYTG